MPIQPLNGQNENPYHATFMANSTNAPNQTTRLAQATAREDVFTLSPAGQQRQNESQTEAGQNIAASSAETQQTNETTQTPAAEINTERETPAPAANEQPAIQPAVEGFPQQQQVVQNDNNGPITGLNVVG